ncbi:PH domain-containing protein [Bacillus piscicola]|uniref:PH domain-containing protein n=1 Tax=Bacillus piscicola TaxID=1632684 RepID=UPI001F099012|nr:PH domain-containing protein [Bacillus piscicola]
MNDETTRDLVARRMHPLWIIFSIGKSIKEMIFFVIFFIINISSDSMIMNVGKIAVILYLIYKVVSILFGWWQFKYVFTDKELQINEGRFVKEKRFIPLERIQSVGRNTSFFHRLFGLTSLTLNTGTVGDESSIKLEVISRKEAERIQRHLRHDNAVLSDESLQEAESKKEEDQRQHPTRTDHYEMTLKEIVVASFTSFSLFVLIPLLITLYSKIEDLFSVDGYMDAAIHIFEKSWVVTALVVVAVLMLSVIFGIGKTYIQYGNFQVTSDEHRIYIQKGFFNHTEFSIPKKKVQAIKWNQSFLRRWLGIVEVKLVSAGGAGEEKIEVASTLFPFISKKRALSLVPEILPSFEIETELKKLPRAAFFVKLARPSYVWIIVTAVVFYFWPERWYMSIALFVLIVISRILDGLHSSYRISSPYIQLQSGSFSTELFLTTRMKIEELEITESWLQRKFGLASLQISTRAKPVRVSTLSDIPQDEAVRCYHWYANRGVYHVRKGEGSLPNSNLNHHS